MWRILYLALFLVWLFKDKKMHLIFDESENQHLSIFQKIAKWFKGIIFLPWDKYLGFFAAVAILVTLFLGTFRYQGFKQIFFLLNIYFLYLVLINTLKSKDQIAEFIRYVIWSLLIIIAFGFTQLFGTFLVNMDAFWVYWAGNVTKLYYGQNLAAVSLYSNSWFSYNNGRELRMFSIMPDSQSFAYICLIALCLGTALTRGVFKHIQKWLWSGIRFAGLALIFSGTRAVWVGMILPFAAVLYGYYKNIQKHLAKKYLIPFIIILLLFAISPFINRGLNYLRMGEKFQENFLLRAQSIYDLNEISNQGRIAIWKSSFKFAATHPLGVGAENFIISLDPQEKNQSYEQLSTTVNKRYNLPQKYISAHNLYLQILVETGVIGFIIFCLFLIAVIKYFWRFLTHYGQTKDFLIYVVAQALLMLLWIIAAAFFDITIFNDKVLMFFFINLGLAGIIVKLYNNLQSDE